MVSRWNYLICFSALFFGAHSTSGSDFQGATHLFPIDEEVRSIMEKAKPIMPSPIPETNRIRRSETAIRSSVRLLAFDHSRIKAAGFLQMLVFSKTSMQRERISPRNPRSLFYNDDVYLGYIPGSSSDGNFRGRPKIGRSVLHGGTEGKYSSGFQTHGPMSRMPRLGEKHGYSRPSGPLI